MKPKKTQNMQFPTLPSETLLVWLQTLHINSQTILKTLNFYTGVVKARDNIPQQISS